MQALCRGRVNNEPCADRRGIPAGPRQRAGVSVTSLCCKEGTSLVAFAGDAAQGGGDVRRARPGDLTPCQSRLLQQARTDQTQHGLRDRVGVWSTRGEQVDWGQVWWPLPRRALPSAATTRRSGREPPTARQHHPPRPAAPDRAASCSRRRNISALAADPTIEPARQHRAPVVRPPVLDLDQTRVQQIESCGCPKAGYAR
jgi:hypothetical protein